MFSLDVSPDGQLVAATRGDGSVRVWDMETGSEAFSVDPGPALAPFMDVTWSPEGELLAVVANDGRTGRATVVDRGGRVLTVRQEEFGTALGPMTFTPDGEQLMTVRLLTGPPEFGRSEVVMWNWRDGGVVPIIDTRAVGAIPSPTGELVATWPTVGPTARGAPVEIWDRASGQRAAVLEGNIPGVVDVAFSPDGSRLATGGLDGTVRVWDPATGEQLLALRGHYVAVTSVAFSPDGSQLASVGGEGVVRVWTLDLDELVEIAERKVTRTLTDEECRQYLHQRRCA